MDLPLARLRANWFGAKPSCSAALMTAAAFSGWTAVVLFMTRDTVLLETPASFAMSWMVVALAMGELGRLTWILGKPADSLIDLKTVSIAFRRGYSLVVHP